MKSIWMTTAMVAVVVALAGCGDRRARNSTAAESTATAEASAPATPAATHPASCGLTPQQAASIPALPANARSTGDPADYQGLRTDDDLLPTGERYDVMDVTAERAGQRLRLQVQGRGFLARVILYDTNGCPWIDAVARPAGAAMIDERLDRAGEYRVLVTSTTPGSTGGYTGTWSLDTETPL